MELVTREQMREMDRRTIEGGIVPGLTLMERAGRGILRSLLRRVASPRSIRIWILCGRGNNGGDGLVLARLLRERGLWPRVLLGASEDAFGGDAAVNLRRARESGLLLEPLGETELAAVARLDPSDLIVDAILGTGLRGPARGHAAATIEAIRGSRARVLAVDIPSGLEADPVDPAAEHGPVVRAEWTVTMAWPKLGFLFSPGRDHVGEVDVVDIGIPVEVSATVGAAATLPEAPDWRSWLPRPEGRTHKGRWGKVLIVGGSPGLTGATILAARAALRTGAGLVRVGIPEPLNAALESALTEAMTIPLPAGEDGQLLASSADRVLSGFGTWDALAVGPGIGRFPETERLVLKLLGGWRGPLLVDADGLTALAKWGPDSWVPRAREIRAKGAAGGLVLTPHAGELSALTGRPARELLADPVARAAEWAQRWGVTLVFKGAPTVTASPEGKVWVNPTGNSGLATGGSGDVLSGVITTLLGQGMDGPRAAALGSCLHGLAADLWVESGTGAQRSLIPGDVVERLPRAIQRIEDGAEGPRWKWRGVA